MKQCEDKTPCLHAVCTETQGVKCCKECEFVGECKTACFKAKDD